MPAAGDLAVVLHNALPLQGLRTAPHRPADLPRAARHTKLARYLPVGHDPPARYLRDEIGFDELAKKVVKPLAGKKIAAYYGCLLLRPGKVMQMDNPENPTIIEDFIKAIGAEPVVYPYRNE